MAVADRLAGKVAIVMGAGSSGPGWGNGKATAFRFAEEGALVICADYNAAAAEESAELIRNAGGRAEARRCDVTKSEEIAALVADIVARHGRIDVLDNNVGIAETGGVVELPEAEWRRVMDVNLTSCFLTMKHVIPVMARQFAAAPDPRTAIGGSIINISSVASIRYTGVAYASYAASKAALNHLTRVTAAQYAPQKIRVNAILPGLMKTPMVERSAGLAAAYAAGDVEAMWRARDAQVPMGHMGDAFDVANAALFLASDESRYITGVELPVDGGVTLKIT
jgi:NAD(P)-dependent dehydrogenase (short-subunit alcohol dehydrogenase family)